MPASGLGHGGVGVGGESRTASGEVKLPVFEDA
jgi:hypothetical protein